MTSLFIYELTKKNIAQGHGFTSNPRLAFFLVSFFPTAYFYDTAYYIII